jgi:digeranylgeranylglycerophospholipid reductase
MAVAKNFDVVVVGGGPAGLSAAAAAAGGSLRVAVIEKDPSVAHTVRTSGVTWLRELEKLQVPSSLYNPVKRYGMYTPNREVVWETSEAAACVLDVRRLYQYLAFQAAAVGVEVFLGTQVRSASYEDNETAVKVSAISPLGQLDFKGSVVIDASGFSTVVGRSLGLVRKWERFGVGIEYEAYVEKIDSDAWALMVGQEYSPAGYAWIFPVAENRARIGVGVEKPESDGDPLKRLVSIIEKRPGPLKKLGRICPLESHFGVVPNEGPRNFTAMRRVLLVGDSAGQVNPLLLEGIRFAIKFGRMAGEAAKRAIDEDEAGEVQSEQYEGKWKKEIWENFQVGLKVQKKWLQLSDEQWDKEMSILESLSAIEVLELLQSQFSPRSLTALAINHPELLKSQTFPTIMKSKMRRAIFP